MFTWFCFVFYDFQNWCVKISLMLLLGSLFYWIRISMNKMIRPLNLVRESLFSSWIGQFIKLSDLSLWFCLEIRKSFFFLLIEMIACLIHSVCGLFLSVGGHVQCTLCGMCRCSSCSARMQSTAAASSQTSRQFVALRVAMSLFSTSATSGTLS